MKKVCSVAAKAAIGESLCSLKAFARCAMVSFAEQSDINGGGSHKAKSAVRMGTWALRNLRQI